MGQPWMSVENVGLNPETFFRVGFSMINCIGPCVSLSGIHFIIVFRILLI